jgi:hypothetical protein
MGKICNIHVCHAYKILVIKSEENGVTWETDVDGRIVSKWVVEK